MQSFPHQRWKKHRNNVFKALRMRDRWIWAQISYRCWIKLTFWTPIHSAVWQMKRTSIDRRIWELPLAWEALYCLLSKHARVASTRSCVHIVHQIESHAIWLENSYQTSYASLSDFLPWCRWRSRDMCGLHSEGKYLDYLTWLQRSNRFEVELDTVVLQRIRSLYLRRKMRRTTRSTGCNRSLGLIDSFHHNT